MTVGFDEVEICRFKALSGHRLPRPLQCFPTNPKSLVAEQEDVFFGLTPLPGGVAPEVEVVDLRARNHALYLYP